MTAQAIFVDRAFYAPHFVIRIDGRKVDFHTVRDITEVTFEDSLDALDYFEFTLHDWDAARNQPKYSSPYDAGGAAQKDIEGKEIPAFEPGMFAELQLGYYGAEDPVTKLLGNIVSIAPSFPDSGIPQMKVRVLSEFFKLQNSQITKEFKDKGDTQIAQELAKDIGIGVATPKGQAGKETPNEFLMLNNEFPINFLIRRARLLGYDIAVIPQPDPTLGLEVTGGGPDDSVLFFGPSDNPSPTYALKWGATLAKFDISVRIKEQVGKVVVKSTNPAKSGKDRDIEATKTLEDLDLDYPDPKLLDAITAALDPAQELVVDEPVQNQAEADAKALGILRERVNNLVTAEGMTVGFPAFRAGNTVEITGIGARYSGVWVLTKTTHKLDSGGYTTSFSARLQGKLP
jgi:phage protein D